MKTFREEWLDSAEPFEKRGDRSSRISAWTPERGLIGNADPDRATSLSRKIGYFNFRETCGETTERG